MNTTSILRHINAVRCLRLLKRSELMSRSDIARGLGLTRTTVGNAVKALLDADLVHEPTSNPETTADSGRIGRPSIGVALNGSGAYFVGLDLSTTALNAVLIDLTMTVVASFTVPVGADLKDVSATTDSLAELAKRVIRAAGAKRDRVRGIGISVPGLVGADGRVAIAPFLQWRDVDLAKLIAKRLDPDFTIRVCNDAVALACAVRATASDVEMSDLLLILMSEGIGSATIRQGRVIEGSSGYAGEIGQMIMAPNIAGDTPQTFQLLAGQRFFTPFLDGTIPVADAVIKLAADPSATPGLSEALEMWAGLLAVGFLNAIWMTDPERIVIGGVLAPLYTHVAARVDDLLGHARGGLRVPPIRVSMYGAEGAALGAAALMRESLFALPALTEAPAD